MDTDWSGRRLLAAVADETRPNCTPLASDTFPSGIFTQEQRLSGLVICNIVITVYSFFMLAVVCHHYFVPAINKFSKDCHISYNVAGASLMAAMASIPQLATTIIGLFVAKDDIGVGTVIGSSFFNILFTPGVCALLVHEPMELECWPIFRDIVAYMISVVTLLFVVLDEEVYWYESVLMIVMYIAYIIVLVFNDHLASAADRFMSRCKDTCGCCQLLSKRPLEDNEKNNLVVIDADDIKKTSDYKSTGTLQSPNVTAPGKTEMSGPPENDAPGKTEMSGPPENETKFTTPLVVDDIGVSNGDKPTEHKPTKSVVTHHESDYQSIMTVPEGWWRRILWLIMLPGLILIFIFIPDFRRPGFWIHLYPLTMIMSVVFIGLTSYVLVWMISLIGETFSIPTSVVGMTIMAAGGSMPDMLNSIFSALDGHGDMAMSNAMGSNMFDILFCLSIPWLFDYFFIDRFQIVHVYEDMLSVSLCLISAGVIVFLATVLNRWRLDKKIGAFFILSYLCFIIVNCIFAKKQSLPFCDS